MIKYVHGVSPERDASNDDLKFPFPAANAGEGLSERPKSMHQMLLASRRDVPCTMFDADDDFDKTITTAADSTMLDQKYPHGSGGFNDDHEKTPSHADPDKALDEDGDSVESYYEDEDEEAGEHPPQGGEAPHVKPDGRRLGRISGDTYPDTTSGRPSTIHTDDQEELFAAAHQQTHASQSMGKAGRGVVTRLAYASHTKQILPRGQSRHQRSHGAQQSTVPPLNPEQVAGDTNSGFEYGSHEAQPSRAVASAVSQSQHLSHNPVPASVIRHEVSAVGNHDPAMEMRREISTEYSRSESHKTTRAPPVQHTVRTRQPEGAHRGAAPNPLQARMSHLPQLRRLPQHRGHEGSTPPMPAFEVAETEMMSDIGDRDIARESSIESKQGTQGATLLDYHPPGLYDMSLDQIKAATFDLDPNATEPISLSTLQPGEPVSKKMDALLTMDAHAKAVYLISLRIEEWEEAGDWFLASFGQLTGQFKTARQEKRKIAREFEDEVEKRYESITKKRKLISGAMDEMKESGGRVLSGTPKKATQMR